MNIEEVERQCKFIHQEMDKQVNHESIMHVEGKLNKLSSLMGLSANLIGQAKRNMLVRQGEILKEDDSLQPAKLKIKIEAGAAYEIMVYEYATKLNSGITHCMDALRSIISRNKVELERSRQGK